ncbi:uncharacterized protein LOC122457291 isoform X2 [Dermochelys coriacea]|uniref:uncharacterized protein LOC122457291 isoform X2 n=1 Tax=Dermochelys coriacea TaxID=27794 RepID=UPI001CA7D0BC|nr:uncharacterized protein LOC122457291 isoform X2 [Dermochelys coriacea]
MLVPCTRPLCTLTRAGFGRCPGPLSPFRGWRPWGGPWSRPPQRAAPSPQPAPDGREGAVTRRLLPMQCVVALKLLVEKLDAKMVPGGAGSEWLGPGPGAKEDHEERVLAVLGIAGTVLNLLVVIFVYVYTTL